jgi:fatty acid synthase subunit alpha, fungi type
LKQFSVEPMSFNGSLFGSHVVAKEAHTSPSLKDLIVAVSDVQWEGTYVKDTGGVITVHSELGEPIHKVNNHALKLWKEYDDPVFKLTHKKHRVWLQKHCVDVFERLNADYFKPWLPAKKDGHIIEYLGGMTYEVVLRLVRLMYVVYEERWLDHSLHNLWETGYAVSRNALLALTVVNQKPPLPYSLT